MFFNPKNHDPEFVLSHISIIGSTTLCKKKMTILVPTNYESNGLVEFGSSLYVVGIFAIEIESKWAVSSAGTMVKISPSNYTIVKDTNGETYFAFIFEAGDMVIENNECVKNEFLNYYIYQHFIYRGHIPDFMSVNDVATMYDTMPYYTGAVVSTNFSIFELSVSRCLRSKENLRTDVRFALEQQSDVFRLDFPSIPIDTPMYTATNVSGLLLGPYIEEAVTNGLLHPSKRIERFEEIIRS